MTLRVFVHVQHLLGIGHLKRTMLIARALGRAGHKVLLASGGTPVSVFEYDGFELVQLPSVRAADARFSGLVDRHGAAIDESFQTSRREALLRLFESFRPDVLMIETFPFGRRQLRFELVPLLESAANVCPRPLIVSSIRDVLQEKRDPERLREQVRLVREYFDRVMVHGDPSFLRLEESFRLAHEIDDRVTYTGYVCDEPARYRPSLDPKDRGQVLVSAGSGAVGQALLEAAMQAKAESRLGRRTWRILVGSTVSAEVLTDLARNAPAGVIVERARPDFPALLGACSVSISQGGYNTVTDVLRAKAKAVIVPFRGAGETEQALRAERLAARGLVTMVEEAELNGRRLAEAVDAASAGKGPSQAELNLDGASRSASLIESWSSERP